VVGNAAEPSEIAECPPIPGNHDVWPYELQEPPHKGETPVGPQQITGITRTHHTGPLLPGLPPFYGAGYCLYAPASSAKGLILFLHGWQSGFEPGGYDPMMQFLATNGYYVVYPYASNVLRDTGAYPQRAGAAVKDAMANLKSKGVDIQKVAVAGHSLGGMTTVRLAARWRTLTEGLPFPSALVLLEPGGSSNYLLSLLRFMPPPIYDAWKLDPEELASIPCTTRLLVIQAQSTAEDPVDPHEHYPLTTAQLLWQNLPQIARYAGAPDGTPPLPQRNFLRVLNDTSHPGIDDIKSTHLVPVALPRVICGIGRRKEDYGCYMTSMKYFGYWRPTLAAVHEAFTGQPLEPDYSPYCSSKDMTGTCAKTRFMGVWQSDGKPATPMLTAAEIPGLATTYPDYCPR
jgi:pimeloyl-ACP methyl ester carboxylesterase